MLVSINGAFGAGKTQTAHELQRRLPTGRVVDPELLGVALHKMLGPAKGDDFQDLPQWRSGVLATLLQADAATDAPLIVPMTLVNTGYFDEIVGGLRSHGVDVWHYSLIASPATLRHRLRLRSGYVLAHLAGRDETWAITRIDRCVRALGHDRYATHIATDDRSHDEVVEAIAAHCGLTLTRPRLSPARFQARRLAVGVRHIRL